MGLLLLHLVGLINPLIQTILLDNVPAMNVDIGPPGGGQDPDNVPPMNVDNVPPVWVRGSAVGSRPAATAAAAAVSTTVAPTVASSTRTDPPAGAAGQSTRSPAPTSTATFRLAESAWVYEYIHHTLNVLKCCT